jgi:hypothetical protein
MLACSILAAVDKPDFSAEPAIRASDVAMLPANVPTAAPKATAWLLIPPSDVFADSAARRRLAESPTIAIFTSRAILPPPYWLARQFM